MTKLPSFLESIPFPGGYSKPEFFEEKTELLGITLHLSGVYTKNPKGEILTGSAADRESYPVERAYFELLERIAIDLVNQETLPPNQTWRLAKSNGVAIGATPETAKENAFLELWERDRFLASWYWDKTPELINLKIDSLASLESSYEVMVASFHATPSVVGIFAFPKNIKFPFVYGLGAARTLDLGAKKAEREFLQRLGFLWGEEIPLTEPKLAPTPLFHQEYYLMKKNFTKVKDWLLGETKENRNNEGLPFDISTVQYEEITPENWKPQLCVIKAKAANAIPLVFGVSEGFSAERRILVSRMIHPVA